MKPLRRHHGLRPGQRVDASGLRHRGRRRRRRGVAPRRDPEHARQRRRRPAAPGRPSGAIRRPPEPTLSLSLTLHAREPRTTVRLGEERGGGRSGGGLRPRGAWRWRGVVGGGGGGVVGEEGGFPWGGRPERGGGSAGPRRAAPRRRRRRRGRGARPPWMGRVLGFWTGF